MAARTLSSLMREAIQDTGLSINELAAQSAVPQQVLQRFISGRRDRLRSDTIEKLMAVVGLEVRVCSSATREERQQRMDSILKTARELETRVETTVKSFQCDVHKPVYREFHREIGEVLVEFAEYTKAVNRLVDGVRRLLRELEGA